MYSKTSRRRVDSNLESLYISLYAGRASLSKNMKGPTTQGARNRITDGGKTVKTCACRNFINPYVWSANISPRNKSMKKA